VLNKKLVDQDLPHSTLINLNGAKKMCGPDVSAPFSAVGELGRIFWWFNDSDVNFLEMRWI
jgi:hypothetical protein